MVAWCRQPLAQRLLRWGKDAGGGKISRAWLVGLARVQGYEVTRLARIIGMPNDIGIPGNRQRTE